MYIQNIFKPLMLKMSFKIFIKHKIFNKNTALLKFLLKASFNSNKKFRITPSKSTLTLLLSYVPTCLLHIYLHVYLTDQRVDLWNYPTDWVRNMNGKLDGTVSPTCFLYASMSHWTTLKKIPWMQNKLTTQMHCLRSCFLWLEVNVEVVYIMYVTFCY